jgi:hypothetical protein
VLADTLCRSLFGQQVMDGDIANPSLFVDGRGHTVVDEPREDIADSGLSRLVPPIPGDDTAVDNAAHARDFAQHIRIHDMAGGCAHDGEQLAGFEGISRGGGDVRVDIANGYRQAGR